MDISHKKISLQSISLKAAQKLLTDLGNSISNPRSGPPSNGHVSHSNGHETNSNDSVVVDKSVSQSWEEVLTLVLSDFSWDEDSENILFVLSSSLPGDR